MSSTPQPGPFTGPIFEVIAGAQPKTTFHAHASVLVKSEKLKALIEGNWKDSASRIIELEDWDEDTVARLIEWLYTGKYSYPTPASSRKTIAFSTFAQSSVEKPKTADITCPLMLLTHIQFKKAGCDPKPDRPLSPGWVSAIEDRKKHGLEAVFLADAKVYALADYILLPELQALAFECLAATFTSTGALTPNTPVIADLVILVDYVYANTVKPREYEEPLRELVTTYIALNFDLFRDEGGAVKRLMDQGGTIVVDVWEKVVRNMGAWRQENEELKRKASKLEAEKSKKSKAAWDGYDWS
ncbi:hypothetical protein OEA41_004269 [Lepraria neglecta]|uniref:BTB domain-containing protein n=1 Tax=Lepraria neglecta TaxID=209136 RepID=A0AAD9YZU7_9LECA|nr:hypothetical protein OEA41_004269 [Lepraria neglecta]